MKNYLLIVICILIGSFISKAQNNNIEDFVPKGYTIFEKSYGDLNKDGEEDCILIIKRIDKDNIVVNEYDETVDRNRRGIIVLFKKQDGYELATINQDCFTSENEDGGVYFPPELLVSVERGNLIIHYAHGRYGFWRYTFRFQESKFKLIGYDLSNNFGPIIKKETSINFLTKRKSEKVNVNENAEGGDEVFEETWRDIKINKLIKLSEIENFDNLNMDY